jgi:hypothetical protein
LGRLGFPRHAASAASGLDRIGHAWSPVQSSTMPLPPPKAPPVLRSGQAAGSVPAAAHNDNNALSWREVEWNQRDSATKLDLD